MATLKQEFQAIAARLGQLKAQAPEELRDRIQELAAGVAAVGTEVPDTPDTSPAVLGAHILVVEDDEVTAASLGAGLEAYGTVHTVDSGEEALQHIKATVASRAVDLVVLDIRLPGIDGHEVLKRIRALETVYKDRLKPHVLMTSASDSRDHVINSLREGASGYLVKPIDPQKLTAQMAHLGMEPVSRSA